jgi:sugar phosphate isomerase/epimerase
MEKGLNRRRFFGAAIGTGAAAAAAGAPAALGHGSDWGWHSQGSVPRNRRGIQLYTMRMLFEDGRATPAEIFRALGHMGYTEVELAGHYELPVDELRSQLRRAGLRPFSGHDGPGFPAESGWEDGYRETLEYAVELGQKYTGLAWFPDTEEFPYASEATWHALAEHLNAAGEIARSEFGLQFFYHNHDFEFLNRQAASGAPVFDILLAETDRDLVKFQLDLFWITEGGGNAIEYLSADPARYFSYHVKDHVWGDRLDESDFEDLGTGMLDFPDPFAAGDGKWLDKHYVVEHDSPWLSHPDDPAAEYKTAQAGIDYLRSVRW